RRPGKTSASAKCRCRTAAASAPARSAARSAAPSGPARRSSISSPNTGWRACRPRQRNPRPSRRWHGSIPERAAMAASSDHLGPATQSRPRLAVLISLGLLSLGLYAGLTVLSFRFETDATDPPILLAVTLLGAASLIWLVALVAVFRCKELHESRAALG